MWPLWLVLWSHIKGSFNQIRKFCYHLFTLISFRTCMNVAIQQILVTIDFHSVDIFPRKYFSKYILCSIEISFVFLGWTNPFLIPSSVHRLHYCFSLLILSLGCYIPPSILSLSFHLLLVQHMDFLCGLDISFSQPANHSLHANISESPFRRLALSLVINWFMSMAQVVLLLIRTQMPDETQTCHFSYLDICIFPYKLDRRPGHLHLKGNSELFPIMPSLWFIWKLSYL